MPVPDFLTNALLDKGEAQPPSDHPSVRRPRRLLIISDVHGNWPALESVLADAEGHYDTICFLGDAVGYGPFPVQCLDFLRRHVALPRWRTGNHDIGLFDRVPNFVWSGSAKATLAIHRLTLQTTRPDLWKWLDRIACLERCGPLVRAYGRSQQVWTHANLQNNLDVYLYPAATFYTRTNLLNLRTYLRRPQGCGWLLAGHSHVPCLFQLPADEVDYPKARPLTIRWGEPVAVDQGHYYLNPGSVGQPRDGNPNACYLLLDTHALTATWRRVAYPIDYTVNEMRSLNLRWGYDYPVEPLRRMLKEGGTAKTVGELTGIYRIERDGLFAIEVDKS